MDFLYNLPLEMRYMGPYLGVGACLKHYATFKPKTVHAHLL